MTDHPMDRASAESCEGTADAHQDGPTGARRDTRPVGPLARLQQLADLWDVQAAEAGSLAGLLAGAISPDDLYYLRGQAADRTECAVQLRNLLGRLADEQAMERNNDQEKAVTAPDDRAIAQAANLIYPILRDHGVMWPNGRARVKPSAADIALRLRALIDDLAPGVRLESGNVAVDWTDDATTGPAKHIGVYVLVGSVPVLGQARPKT